MIYFKSLVPTETHSEGGAPVGGSPSEITPSKEPAESGSDQPDAGTSTPHPIENAGYGGEKVQEGNNLNPKPEVPATEQSTSSPAGKCKLKTQAEFTQGVIKKIIKIKIAHEVTMVNDQ